MKKYVFIILGLAIVSLYGLAGANEHCLNIAPGLKLVDEYTIAGDKSFLTGYAAQNADGTINVVVEIPAGTTAKWEATKPDGRLEWEFKNGKPRVVKYLGYPGNYGMVPQTLLPEELGGDGDPLDVIVLGPTISRGAVVKAKAVGVLKMLDGGEQDHKILVVTKNSPFYAANNLKELREKHQGVIEITEIWFVNYKGPGKIKSLGYGDVDEAGRIIKAAIDAFKNQ